ncbi:pilin N-terminal domain-containing protein [Anaerococcus sp. Marseille-Q5996]|uniref:pilin N-terminal domain-containing protein n=1 Tax=Anaerococcus sp. Marseille-Q5996 TaxID=2972769 RepID=UPI0021C58938|nr:isopeptide-forming domain-containing fimbrial protein [Anaerococcus sp. Marseille-Q5996]
MKKATNKLMPFLAAFAMVIGVLVAPFTTANADEATETESVTIHKILLTKEALDAHDVDKEYDGTTIGNIKEFFGDQSAEEIDGVYFKLQSLKKGIAEDKIDVNNDDQWEDVVGKEGKTENKAGLKLDTKGLSGTYRIVEDLTKSTYNGKSYFDKEGNQLYKKGEDFFRPKKDQEKEDVKVEAKEVITKENNLLADSKAVPTLLTLPMVNEKGTIKEGHVYPKNTQEKPEVDKDFKENNELRPVNAEDAKEIKGGADVKDNQRDKKVATTDLGEKVPYEIKTNIPAKTKYKTLAWDDTMSKGLTFNDDVKLQIGGENAELGTDYIVTYKKANAETKETGFVIQLLDAGLEKVNNKDKETEIYITYSATVNEDAEVDVKENNKLDFYYDNNVSVNGKPEPTNPVDGKIKVTKDFPNVTGDWVKGEEVIVTIIDEETGKPVVFKDDQEATVTLTENNKTHEWTGLDNNKKYKVVETFKPSDIVTYEKSENGEVIIHDEIKPEDEQPKKITPSVPEVVLGGKKFVKTNQDGTERLEGAEFYVKNAEGKYLVEKMKDEKAVADAKAALDEAVEAYNKLDAEAQNGEEGKNAKALVDEKQDAYDKAVKANASGYDWGEKANAVVLKSNAEGQFEIKGLAYAEGYQLEEKTAPEGYAKRQEPVDFKVEEGSYSTKDVDIKYEKTDAENNAKQIENKKVTIPQTGGIGSLIFIVAGLALMGVAFVAMKRRNSYEEA